MSFENEAPQRVEKRVEFDAAERGEALELRALTERRVKVRGVDLIVGAEQEILRATTTYQGRNRITVTEDHLREMAANADEFPFIPIDFDHLSGKGPDGVAGGVILTDSLRVHGGKLYGIPAYNEHTAGQVREKKWLGVSPRFTLQATSKNTGKPVGAALLALSLTNTPQLHDITVATEFDSSATDSAAALDNATETVANTNESDDAPTIHEDSMDTAKLAKALGMDGETDEDKLFGRIKSLMAGSKKDEEMSANVEELTAARDAASERAEKAEAEVAELSAKLESATSNLTDAEKQAAELTAKVEEFGARLDESEKAREAERAEAEVNEFALKLNLGAKEREFALKLRTSNADLWNEWKAERESEGPSFQREFKGGSGTEGGENVIDWAAYVEKVKSDNDLGSEQEAAEFALRTDEGSKLYEAFLKG